MHAAAAAVSVPAAAAIAAAAARDAAASLSAATDEPRLAGSDKKSCGSLFLAAIFISAFRDGYSRTCECRAPFGMPTKGMVEVSPEVPSRMTPLSAGAPKLALARRFPLSGTHFHFFSRHQAGIFLNAQHARCVSTASTTNDTIETTVSATTAPSHSPMPARVAPSSFHTAAGTALG